MEMFNVGDHVRIKSNNNEFHHLLVGSIGRVVVVDDYGTCLVEGICDHGELDQWVEIEELEKV